MICRIARCRPGVLAVLALLTSVLSPAWGGWSVGVSLGAPCRPRCYHPHYYYRPYPVFVRAAPVYVQPVAVVEPVPVPVAVPAAVPATYTAPPAPAVTRVVLDPAREGDVERYQRQLEDPDPRERAEAAVQLGRLHAPGCLTALTATLNNDRSPLVREASARGLGLYGSADALDSLQRVAQSDEDRGVRHSAAYAADVIRANLSRR